MKRLIQITLLGVLSLLTGAFAQVSTSKWQAKPIIIDGDGSDWGTLPRFFNSDANVKYEFRNDDQNLYLILKAGDRATQMQMMAAGFSVKLKVKTSPAIKVGITFPPMKKGEMPSMQMNQEGRTDKLVDKSMTKTEFMPKDTIVLDGFMFSKGIITNESGDEKGICFAKSKLMRDLTSYEFRIPFREIFGNEFVLGTVSDTPIQLQVAINELSQKEMKGMKGRRGGGMQGGGRGMPGGGMPGGGGEMGGGMSGEGMGGGMPGGGMGGGMPGGGGEMGGGMPPGDMPSGMNSGFSMERKSFSIDFKLSTGK